jgi:hypothetical protein
MWMFTQLGFFSIVKKPDGYHIRARQKQDLVNLGLEPVKSYPGSDYPWRGIVKESSKWDAITDKLMGSIDYPNFKSRIAQRPDQKHRNHRYHAIWALMGEENSR